MIITFGKHKGKDLEDIPDEYLRWLITTNMSETLILEAEKELEYRDNYNLHKYE